VDVASPRFRLLKFRKGVSPCQGKTGRLPHNFPLQKANFGKGKIAKFKGEMALLDQILARWPFWKAKMREMKAQKAKMKDNESPKNQMKGNEGQKAKNCKTQPVSPLIKFV